MENRKKILFIILCVVLAICQLEIKVYGYTQEEVKEITEFKTVEDDGEPEDYDILIDARDLIQNQKIPCVQSSIDTILYQEKNELDINFFDTASNNTNEIWNFISGLVRNGFRVFLSIALAASLTLLIYIAVILVYSTISKKQSFLPLGKFFMGGKEQTPGQYAKEKRFIEQWIISVLILALLPFAIILIISFAGFITDISNQYTVEEEELTIFVQNAQINGDNVDYYFKTNLEGLLMFQTQYNWDNFTARNIMYMICGIIVTIFKIFLYVLFVVRMAVVAALTTISPILILVNAFLRISGNKGILTNWLILYLFCILIKPVMELMYFILVKSNTYVVQENPVYILMIIAIMVTIIIFSIRSIYREFQATGQKNVVNRNT